MTAQATCNVWLWIKNAGNGNVDERGSHIYSWNELHRHEVKSEQVSKANYNNTWQEWHIFACAAIEDKFGYEVKYQGQVITQFNGCEMTHW